MGLLDGVLGKLRGEVRGDAPIHNVEDQPQEDQDLCTFVRNKLEERRSSANRVAHEGVWMTNIAYVLGFDSVYYDPQLRQYRPTDTARKYVSRNRLHSNQLLPACQNRLARMVKNPPKYDTRPNSMDEEDKEASQLGLEVIGQVWDIEHVNRKRIDLGMWKQQCGHSYIHVSNDPDVGEPVINPETKETGFTGKTKVEIASALECFPDELAKTFEECTDFIRAKVRKLDYFRERYERGYLVKPEGAWLLSAQYEMRINTMTTAGPAYNGGVDQMKDAAIEISYYEKPTKKYPNGRHVITANGVLLKNDELPIRGEIPFAKFDDAIVGGKYYSEALLTHARPLQDQYNKVLEKRKRWTDLLLAGKYIAAKGHGLIQEAFTDQSGEVVEYDPVPNAAEPHAMPSPQMPEYAYKETDYLLSDMNQIMGLSEVSRGILPSAAIPAVGMQILLEQDETRIGVEIEQDEHAWARVGQLILKCEAQYAISDRKLKTKNKSGYVIKNYNGKMLRENFDVTVIRGSSTPNVKVIERQEIMNAYTQGLLGDPNDPAIKEKVLGMLEYGDVSDVWEDQRLDMAQINRTIEQIEEEQTPLVNKLDNHPLHILMKNRYRKSDKYESLSDTSKLILENDIEAHVKCIVAITNPGVNEPPDMDPHPDRVIDFLKEQQKGIGAAPQEQNTLAPEQPNPMAGDI